MTKHIEKMIIEWDTKRLRMLHHGKHAPDKGGGYLLRLSTGRLIHPHLWTKLPTTNEFFNHIQFWISTASQQSESPSDDDTSLK